MKGGAAMIFIGMVEEDGQYQYKFPQSKRTETFLTHFPGLLKWHPPIVPLLTCLVEDFGMVTRLQAVIRITCIRVFTGRPSGKNAWHYLYRFSKLPFHLIASILSST